ncbi:MAG: lactate racemase domain-containing protein [Clostridia bacterium]|nr:lactate racemase domain-containing protein [Clostridia bacterium]
MTINLSGGFHVEMPKMVPIKQNFNKQKIEDINGHMDGEFIKFLKNQRSRLTKGSKIAIAVGSRGIHDILPVVKRLIYNLKAIGVTPVVIPAMGSHGGATAEGQVAVLKALGITEASVGAEIISSMKVTEIGRTPKGVSVYVENNALNSDGIIIINRVKPHTGFKGSVESGLLKMIAIGLGKQKGATVTHNRGFDTFPTLLEDMTRVALQKSPIIGGLAIVENAYKHSANIELIQPERIIERDKELLNISKELFPRIKLDPVDVLIVQEMGKEISGPGMDPNITGRSASKFFKRELTEAPKIDRMIVLELTEKTKGNATGLGTADVTTKDLFHSINFDDTYANVITSTVLEAGRIPVVMENDLQALQVALKCCSRVAHPQSKIVWIKNTLSLEYIYVSETYLSQIQKDKTIEILGEPEKIPFTEDGKLQLKNRILKYKK